MQEWDERIFRRNVRISRRRQARFAAIAPVSPDSCAEPYTPRDCAAQLVEHLGRRANMIQALIPPSFFDFSTDGALLANWKRRALSCLEEATLITSRRLQATSRLS